MGFWNRRSALVNLSQNLNTIIVLGPRWTVEGFSRAFTPEGNAIWEKSGWKVDAPTMYYEQFLRHGPMTKFAYNSLYLFNKVEQGNHKVAYLGAFYKQMSSMGKGLKDLTPEEFKSVQDYARGVKMQTNFEYGPTGMSMASTTPAGRVIFQYMSFPVKQVRFLKSLGALKLMAYIAAAEGGHQFLLHNLGLDISNALGVGFNSGEFLKAFKTLGSGKPAEALARFRGSIALPLIGSGQSTGIFPSGIAPAISTLSSAAKMLQEGLYGGDWRLYADDIMPVALTRAWKAARAMEKGVISSPYNSMYGLRQEGLPIYNPVWGGTSLEYLMTPKELAMSTFFGRTKMESDTSKFAQIVFTTEKIRSGVASRLAEEYAKPERDEGAIQRLRAKSAYYNVILTKQRMLGAMERSLMTRGMRLLKNVPKISRPMMDVNKLVEEYLRD